MDLDDELRSLFSDDRLDLAVKPGVAEEIVVGARRIRRRRQAVTTTFVVAALAAGGFAISNLGSPQTLPPAETTSATLTTSPVPTTTSSLPPVIITETHTITKTVNEPPPANTPDQPTGAPGYGKLKLGMKGEDALATGVLLQPSNTKLGECPGYRSEGVTTDEAAVLISPTLGVARITLPGFAKTSTGIGAGSTAAEVKAKYPAAKSADATLAVDMTGSPAWRYVFVLDSAQKVSSVRMEIKNSDCGIG